ncbi:Lanosterol synthase (Oxidosqualene--lanosterol cyclase) [Modicella reniformis]|uniref:Terpene cyclase/mutase family member n=1 Tax=Modicella reniformis TaxID=1440133 RepID=A0A9P6IMH1_9FUNG|nr:Lanosterol synthase (Oxidosqualene--lanosterol cyclase) [Modicella reniformis]
MPGASINTTHNPTDRTRWRLRVDEGKQTWHYLSEEESKADPQTDIEKYWLNLKLDAPELPKAKTALEAAGNGFEFFKRLQNEEGFWSGEYGGPMFLIPGLVIAYYVTGVKLPEGWSQEIIQYLFNKADEEDGGWGLHIEGHSTVFRTALNYIVLRLLGVDAEHPVCIKARGTLHKLGGATGAPSWGKFWMAALGVYEWEGMNPVPPELWLLPHIIPFHPARYWCHTRNVYIPMSYLYGRRATHPLTDLTRKLREELYTQPYDTIPWYKQRNNICKADEYYPHSRLLDFLNGGLVLAEKVTDRLGIRSRALKAAYAQVKYEDENTHYLDIGPVNKTMNMLSTFYEEGKDSEAFKRHVENNIDFMWMSGGGMMMNGTNGSQLWDTALLIQGLIESGLANEPQNHEAMKKGLMFLDNCQIRKDPPFMKEGWRDRTLGAWPFSNKWQGYTVSDCTSEGLKAVLLLQGKLSFTEKRVSDERLNQAVDIVLDLQNSNGGFASYESVRGPQWLELINPAEVFGNIMIEYTYPECSTACVLGLTYFREQRPDYRRDEIDATIERAVKYILDVQRADGSWYGSWAICFTYATMFACESLNSVGLSYSNSEAHRYVEHENSQVVQTSWALMALMAAKCPDHEAIKRGIRLLMARQKPDGQWQQEAIEGIFNHSCSISYPNYKHIFTIWALGRYAKIYGDDL